LLSFSVGGMLGDVFLHVLPEVWISSKGMFKNICLILLFDNHILFVYVLKIGMVTGYGMAGGFWQVY
jgi:hypothetical protein